LIFWPAGAAVTSGSVGAGEAVAVLERGPDILWFDIEVLQHIGWFPPCIGIKVLITGYCHLVG
jgi:hypothetical protein